MTESNRLPVLAAEIKAAHADAQAAAVTSAERSIAAGRALLEARELVKHGEWLPFLAQAGVHERAAQRLMKLAASGLKSDTVSDLGGVSRALEFVRLKDRAIKHLNEAQHAAGRSAEESLPSLEKVLDVIGEMVGMFPDENVEQFRPPGKISSYDLILMRERARLRRLGLADGEG
jgi:hypothetical protein